MPQDALLERTRSSGQQVQVSRLEEFSKQQFSGSDLKLGRVLDDNAAYTRYYITYQSGELTISGIMNVPKGQGPFPLLILNHGYIGPAVYTNGRGLKREQDYLARRGYVVLHPDYRNHADSTKVGNVELNFRLGYVEDVINAINAAKYSGFDFIDTSRVGMLGHSMGGGVAQTIMVTHPDLVDAFVLFAPVSSNYVDSFNKWVVSRREVAEEIRERYGSPDEFPDFWAGLSPRTYFGRVSSPVMLHHGAQDESVPLAWSERTVALLQEKEKDIIFHVYEGEKHEFIDQWPLVMQRTVDFFDEHLR
ncbi:MAG: alpha/beta fold hydrolase [Patescibacteria group bacterium]